MLWKAESRILFFESFLNLKSNSNVYAELEYSSFMFKAEVLNNLGSLKIQ